MIKPLNNNLAAVRKLPYDTLVKLFGAENIYYTVVAYKWNQLKFCRDRETGKAFSMGEWVPAGDIRRFPTPQLAVDYASHTYSQGHYHVVAHILGYEQDTRPEPVHNGHSLRHNVIVER